MASNKGRRLVASIIVLVGAILLIAALFTPWYTTKVSNAYATETQTFYPGFPSQNGTIQYSCSGEIKCPSQTSYSSLNYNNTGMIAEEGFFMLVLGAILGIIGMVFGVMSRGNPRRAAPAIALAIIALILALIAPTLYAVVLPGAVSKDIPTAARPPTSSGPWSSFMGSSSFVLPEIGSNSVTWGPTTGWYLAFAAFAVLLIGVILLVVFRKEPAPAPAAAPAATGTTPTAPPPSTP